jgi:hypothetical protein
VEGVHQAVPIREVQREVLGGEAVVHVVVQHRVEPLGGPTAPPCKPHQLLDRRDEGADLIPSMATCEQIAREDGRL